MFRSNSLASILRPLTVLAVLLLLCGLAFPGTARAQDQLETFSCLRGATGLPPELARLDLAGVQAALQAMVDEDPNATLTLPIDHEGTATIRADLLLADEEALAALLEVRAINLTAEYTQEGQVVFVAISASTAQDCTFPDLCPSGIGLPAALGNLDVTGLRAALEELIAQDADATVTASIFDQPAVVRADLLLGLGDPVLAALLSDEVVNVTLVELDEPAEIVGITLPGGTTCEDVGGPPGPEPGDIQDGQQGDDGKGDQQSGAKPTVPDNQQMDGDKDTGTGDDQQDGVKPTTPDNQQTGGGKGTVTKTFELTLNGAVPADQAFGVVYSTSEDPEELIPIALCGQPGGRLADKEDCQGDGSVYRAGVDLEAGTTIKFVFFRVTEGDPESYEAFHLGTETIDADMTNTAWYTFGEGIRAGDEQQVPDNQQTGGGKEPGAGDDQQDDTQDQDTGVGDDGQDEAQDDQQAQVPEEMPETGAGGLASGATVPVGNAAAGLTMLIGAGYAVLRRR